MISFEAFALLPLAAASTQTPLGSGTGLNTGGEVAGIFSYITQGGPVVLGTLGLLVLLSVICWILIGVKGLQIRAALSQTRRFLSAWDLATSFADGAAAAIAFPQTPLAEMVRAVRDEIETQQTRDTNGEPGARSWTGVVPNANRAMRRAARDGMARLEARLGFLATTASAAPFIGLFGTVWGIMDAFRFIRADQPILTTVAPHIAQALIATAVGLATAIPAVMAYNLFVGRVRAISIELDSFSDDLLNRIQRAYAEPDSQAVAAQRSTRGIV